MTDPADRIYWTVLVLRCQVGERAAMEELVERCQPRLRGFLYKLLLGRADLDDVTQDVWADVFRGLPALSQAGSFLPWFYRIARNRAMGILRSSRQPPVAIDAEEVPDPRGEEIEFSAEDAGAVHAALDELSIEHREVLLLKFMENMSYDQIADVIGCQMGTVRSRIHHAKRHLRRIIDTGGSP
jgi:RNA polymerase sigma-70 factor (ECF subfamily)